MLHLTFKGWNLRKLVQIQYICLCTSVSINCWMFSCMIYYMFSYRYYLKKRDTLATLIQDEVQQVHRVLLKNYITALSVDRK